MKKKCDKYSQIDKEIRYICDNEYQYFLNKANVVGVALGFKISNGFKTYRKCIKVIVFRKILERFLNKNDIIPKCYKGIETDVIEKGFPIIQSFTHKIRPVLGGYSISNEISIGGGTMGCLVSDGQFNYILSNNHVIADNNNAKIGSKIIQPATADGGKSQTDTIAILSKFIPLKNYLRTNYVDCAMGKVLSNSLVSTKIALIGNINESIVPILSMPVKKVGATSELTTGIVESINSTIVIRKNYNIYLFKKQIILSHMIDPGDSGSILLDYNNHVVGLIMGSARSSSIANPIELVLKALKVHLVTN